MKILLLKLSFLLVIGSCVKTADPEPKIVICVSPGDIGWIKEKKKEYAGCRCLVEFRSGIYQNQQVFEIRIIDPLCNGIPMVFKADGSPLIPDFTPEAFKHYLDNVKDSQVFWTCSRGQ